MFKSVTRFFSILFKHRCKGDCCKHFYLPLSPQELQDSYNRSKGVLKDNGTIYKDIETIAQMVELVEIVDNSYFYKCNHLTTNGDCGIYSTRPWMCSAYPYDSRCLYPTCNWRSKRAHKNLRKYGQNCKKLPWATKESIIATSPKRGP